MALVQACDLEVMASWESYTVGERWLWPGHHFGKWKVAQRVVQRKQIIRQYCDMGSVNPTAMLGSVLDASDDER